LYIDIIVVVYEVSLRFKGKKQLNYAKEKVSVPVFSIIVLRNKDFLVTFYLLLKNRKL